MYTKINILDNSKSNNTNLLDNWYFVNPINQKGFTINNTAGYSIDRWYLNRGTLTLTENGISLISTVQNRAVVLYQRTEMEKFILGSTITFSAIINNSILYGSIQYTSNEYIVLRIDSETNSDIFLAIELNEQNGKYAVFNIYNNSLTQPINVMAAKVEISSNQTLAKQDSNGNWVLADPVPDYTEQLLRCQKYFYRLYNNRYRMVTMIVGQKRAYFTINLPSVFVKTPTINCVAKNETTEWIRSVSENGGIYKLNQLTYYCNYNSNFTNSIIEIYFILPDILTDAQLLINGYIDFDANL